MPTCSVSLPSKLGFLSDVEAASFSLKWTPFFFRERKCANLAFAVGSGDPGGDGGMSRFGTGGNVKSWTSVLVEPGEDIASVGSSFAGCDGPTTGALGWIV